MPEDKLEPIYDQVVRTIAEVTGLPAGELNGQTALITDIGLDSLAIFEIVINLEETYGIRISDEEIDQVKTISQIVDYIAQHLPAHSGKQD